MRLDEEVLFYHSQEGNAVMGLMKVIKEFHQDRTTDDERWVSLTFEPIESFEKPVSLSQIKWIEELKNIGLIRQPRLAVMQLQKSEFDLINN